MQFCVFRKYSARKTKKHHQNVKMMKLIINPLLVEDTREIGEKRDFHTKLPNQYLIKTLLLFNNKSENVVNSKNSNNTTQPKT